MGVFDPGVQEGEREFGVSFDDGLVWIHFEAP